MFVTCGDCLELLKTLPPNSVDSVVTDPPAGIAFMGKEWDKDKGGRNQWVKWMTEVMQECLRVLKPGGHALVWTLPRTSHWTAWAVEDAGFEIRDSICHLFGSGFPKSHNLAVAFDKKAGMEDRGKRITVAGYQNETDEAGGAYAAHVGQSELAKQWQGWGTALKPAREDWILARKPLEGTVAQNVQTYGTGGLNIDGCRIAPTGERLGGGGEKKATFEKAEGWSRPWMSDPEHASAHATKVVANVEKATELGRWPAHLVLSHTSDCVCNGTKTVKGSVVSKTFHEGYDGESTTGFVRGVSYPGNQHGNGDGTETVEDWECAEGCPVRILNEQSGNVGAFAPVKGTEPSHSGEDVYSPRGRVAGTFFDDIGGASRFFYVAKPTKWEKNVGAFKNNKHPTVKSFALMQWLCRLITPPGGLVLDPFSGSGTTGCAAIREGFEFIGFEKDPEYAKIAQGRIAFWKERVRQKQVAGASVKTSIMNKEKSVQQVAAPIFNVASVLPTPSTQTLKDATKQVGCWSPSWAKK
jgi:DNA modification methylase